jgi:hypothetical protein
MKPGQTLDAKLPATPRPKTPFRLALPKPASLAGGKVIPPPLPATYVSRATVAAQPQVFRHLAAMGAHVALADARVSANAEAERLGTVRSQHHTTEHGLSVRTDDVQQPTNLDSKFLKLLLTELEAGFAAAPTPASPTTPPPLPSGPGALTGAPPVSETPQQRAQQAVALIERIERFVKSGRPVLALSLGNSLGARVEIERVGPKAIALKLVGQGGPPPPEAVARIREALTSRGLTVRALSVV